ncbi:MAG: stage III sporulation protein AA [Lachnospira sp.]|nr:stage III sporulation protein AA [Lachnospira sp.]
MDKKDEILRLLALEVRKVFAKLDINFNKLYEIRLRVNKPIILAYENDEFFITQNAVLTNVIEDAIYITKNEFKETMEYISNYSLYAFEEEIKQGFITVNGGHRVGICGKVVLNDKNIKTIKNISYINIRIAHEVIGCANEVIPYLRDKKLLKNTLIISPPGCGKTTLLRDIVRQMSNAKFTVGLVDERSEIAACYLGIAQNDVGIRTDILDCCPKTEGMLMLIRSMAPDLIAVDEIGKKEDADAIRYVINSGCAIFATIHGMDLADVIKKPHFGELISDKLFERYIILSNTIGRIAAIYDSEFREMRCDKCS